jgi:hypothetical protein
VGVSACEKRNVPSSAGDETPSDEGTMNSLVSLRRSEHNMLIPWRGLRMPLKFHSIEEVTNNLSVLFSPDFAMGLARQAAAAAAESVRMASIPMAIQCA